MDYNEWRSALFDDTYPKSPLSHGEIFYGGKNPDGLRVKWGTHEFQLDLMDFYQGETKSPLADIKKWIYSHMPALPEEYKTAVPVYNHISEEFDAFIPRPMGYVFPLRNVKPEHFPLFGDINAARRNLKVEMDGTVLCMYTKDKKIPSSFAVSHKEVFTQLVNDYIDYDDNLLVLLPDSINTNHIFAGHSASIQRLADNFYEETTLMITAGEWFNKLDLQRKGEHG